MHTSLQHFFPGATLHFLYERHALFYGMSAMVLLFMTGVASKTTKVSQYELVSSFLPGTNATMAVAGDTGGGCKFVLLDRLGKPSNKK